MPDLTAGMYASSRHTGRSTHEVGEGQAAVQSPEAREQLRLVIAGVSTAPPTNAKFLRVIQVPKEPASAMTDRPAGSKVEQLL